mmetsp:Transcript_110129/g.316895  ORF Transcript_110129/g.316895 Transcript_110129/m.316895 type:complete len:255 (-) Transcript_110129:344-1108(-)
MCSPTAPPPALPVRVQAALAVAASVLLCGLPWIATAALAPGRFGASTFPVSGLGAELWQTPLHWTLMLGVAIAFEPATFLIHKYIMHGCLWWVHEDHHHDTAYTRPELYKNDFFPLVFAVPSSSVACWTATGFLPPWVSSMIFGALLYGLAYLYVHEELFHKRFGLPFTAAIRATPYVKRLATAHGMHHSRKNAGAGDVAFGFLYAPPRFEASHVRGLAGRGNGDAAWEEETLANYYGPLFGFLGAFDRVAAKR